MAGHFSRKHVSIYILIFVVSGFLAACGGGGASTPKPAPQATSVTLSVTPQEIVKGSAATLTWTSSNATSIIIDNGIGPVATSGSMQVSPEITTAYTATASGPGGTRTANATLNVSGPVSLDSFTASASAIGAGQSATLSWTASNASSVTINPGIGTFAASGSATVSPASTTTYTAVANGAAGATDSKTQPITVMTQPPTLSASSDKTTVYAGELVTLTWSAENATAVAVEPEIEIEGVETFPLSGTATVSPTQTTTYTFSATGPLGSASQPVAITVNHLPPTISLTADRTTILPGESATLSWSGENADSITLDNGIGSVAVPSGSQSVTPSATTTYTATATGQGGTETASVTVTVANAGELGVSLTVSPATIPAGQSATLTWDSQNAASVTIANCPACSGLSGSATVSPSATTTYTATATSSGGATRTQSATLTVVAAGGFKEKIKHIIFYMQENRSFDQYFGRLGAYRASKGLPPEIDGQDLNTVLIDFYGHQVSPFRHQTVCHDVTSPGWNETHFFAHKKTDGKYYMDFWLRQQTDSQWPNTNGRDPHYTRSMGYFTEQELPYYYELATQFATSDRFFASMMGPTVPNRMYLFTGTSFGHIRPDEVLKAQLPNKRWPQKTFFEHMTQYGVKWKYYYQNGAVFLADFDVWDRDPVSVGRVRNISEFYSILADPKADELLAPVVFLEQNPEDMLNEHPSNKYGPQPGAANTKKILDALMKSAAWKSSVLILTYDEAGGVYDHVPPVPLPHPDGIPPIFKDTDLKQGADGVPYDFNESGFRVPLIVVSPWVKKNFVSHTPRDFTAILKLIETRFDLPPLTNRDAASDDMLEFFDFDNPSWLTPPPLPEQPWINQAMVNDGLYPAADPGAGVCNRAIQVAPGHPGP